MATQDEQVQQAIESWKEETIPTPRADYCQRAWLADQAMATRRLIQLVAEKNGVAALFKVENPVVAEGGLLRFSCPGGEQAEERERASDPQKFECKELCDDVGGGTQGWMSMLIPPLHPCLSERVYMADLACAMRRLVECTMPVGTRLDEDGNLILPERLRPTGTGS